MAQRRARVVRIGDALPGAVVAGQDSSIPDCHREGASILRRLGNRHRVLARSRPRARSRVEQG